MHIYSFLLHLRSVNPGYCLHTFKATPEQAATVDFWQARQLVWQLLPWHAGTALLSLLTNYQNLAKDQASAA